MFRGLRPLPTLSLLFLTPTVRTVAFPFSGQHMGPHSLSDQGPFSGQSEVKSKYPKQSQRQGVKGGISGVRSRSVPESHLPGTEHDSEKASPGVWGREVMAQPWARGMEGSPMGNSA